MPEISSAYNPSFPFKNGHIATIYAAKFRSTPNIYQQRERIWLDDGDFLDVDWSYAKIASTKTAILLHGLEGNAQRTYIKCMAQILNENGWDVAAVNFRGCSGEMNINYQSYNAGKTDDLEAVMQYVLEKDLYNEISLVGFSLGGNLMLKYLGERETLHKEIKNAVAISTPLDLKGGLDSLTQMQNWIYRTSFLLDLKKKYREKMILFPEKMTALELKEINSLLDFDNAYTAPAHGFEDAFDYYEKNSSGKFLPKISVPVYILNAKNDSFLSENSYPHELASKMNNIYFEAPKYGGHVGFHLSESSYYHEKRTIDFLNNSLH